MGIAELEVGIAELEVGIAELAGLERRVRPVKRVRGLKPPRLVGAGEVGIAELEAGIAEGDRGPDTRPAALSKGEARSE